MPTSDSSNKLLNQLWLPLTFTAFCFALAFWYGLNSTMPLQTVMTLVLMLSLLEVSLSFDNAVVNASVLQDMDEKWQRYFLTWGILIAVFGMRLVFPIAIVAVTASLSPLSVINLALDDPIQYSLALAESHVQVTSFGSMFLLLTFLTFLCDEGKTLHWWEVIEEKLVEIGKLESVEIIIAILVLLAFQSFLPEEQRLDSLIYGLSGIVLFVSVDSLSNIMDPKAAGVVTRSGAMGFIYLEILDASFSFDGVLGAFAITNDIVIIMLGLAIGAMYVRSLTVYLVRQGTLQQFAFLEHGAHYAIGALAVIMLISLYVHIPEVITGLIGITFIVLSLISSVLYKRPRIQS